MQTLTRETVAVSSLKPAPWNPRKIDANAMAGLEASIEKFGLVQEIVVNRRSMQVVGGHQRLKVLKRKKIKDAAVVFVDLDEPDEKALNVALNSPHIAGEFVDEDLQPILDLILQERELLFSSLRLDKLLDEALEDVIKDLPHPKETFYVIAQVENEEEQKGLFTRLMTEGFKVKLQTT